MLVLFLDLGGEGPGTAAVSVGKIPANMVEMTLKHLWSERRKLEMIRRKLG